MNKWYSTRSRFLFWTSRCAPSPPRRVFPGGCPPGPPRKKY